MARPREPSSSRLCTRRKAAERQRGACDHCGSLIFTYGHVMFIDCRMSIDRHLCASLLQLGFISTLTRDAFPFELGDRLSLFARVSHGDFDDVTGVHSADAGRGAGHDQVAFLEKGAQVVQKSGTRARESVLTESVKMLDTCSIKRGTGKIMSETTPCCLSLSLI